MLNKLREHPSWPWIKRGATALFFGVVAWLLWRYSRNVDWDEVMKSLRDMSRPALMTAIALAATSHLLYSCFDLIGRRYTGHKLSVPTVMAVNFVSYAFNLCIGSLVGGVAFRYRLYSRLGLNTGVITRVVTMSMLTNWMGYMLLAGLLFALHPITLPPSWGMGNHGLQWVGAGLIAVALGYLAACVFKGERSWNVHGHDLELPHWRMALFQLGISCVNWSVMAGVVWMLLGQKVEYTDVLTVLLVGAIAGVVAHVPAGVGVFEAVFIALLGHRVPEPQILAALLGYRAIYYIAPLMIAAVMYLFMEFKAKKLKRASGDLQAA